MNKSISILIGVAVCLVFSVTAQGQNRKTAQNHGLQIEDLGNTQVTSSDSFEHGLQNRKIANDGSGGGPGNGGLSAADAAMYQKMMKDLEEYKAVMQQRNKDLEKLLQE